MMRNIATETRVRVAWRWCDDEAKLLGCECKNALLDAIRTCTVLQDYQAHQVTNTDWTGQAISCTYVCLEGAVERCLANGSRPWSTRIAVRMRKHLRKIFRYLLGWGSIAGTFQECAQKLKFHGQPTEQASFRSNSSATSVAISEASSMRSSP
jgi:hypothetical protein